MRRDLLEKGQDKDGDTSRVEGEGPGASEIGTEWRDKRWGRWMYVFVTNLGIKGT